MTDPITPPSELVDLVSSGAEAEIAKKILQWAAPILRQQGADQELEACCQALYNRFASPGHQAATVAQEMRDWLRAARRPKGPTRKERALKSLDGLALPDDAFETIRFALETLPND